MEPLGFEYLWTKRMISLLCIESEQIYHQESVNRMKSKKEALSVLGDT